jgi:glutamate racemase
MINFAFLLWSTLLLAQPDIKVATFDSGFGGYFTAKEIENQSNELLKTRSGELSIAHYGDTANAPYGEKSPEQIAEFSAKGINRAFQDGAEMVFIACNTASTQFAAIQTLLNKTQPGRGDHIVSIIDSSVIELKRRIDELLKTKATVQVALLATPATIKNGAYVKALASAYSVTATETPLQNFTQERWFKEKGKQIVSVSGQVTLKLSRNKTIFLSLIGPANWVEMIEHGASKIEKTSAIARDLSLLAPKTNWDIVGEFCTHFPAVDEIIKTESAKLSLSSPQTRYIKQGPLMAEIFRKTISPRLSPATRKVSGKVMAKIFISGSNLRETKNLAQEIFPTAPTPVIQQISF